MKALDKRNETARKKAGDQPYYKLVINYERACPHCDASLRTNYGGPPRMYDYECDCGFWVASWTSNDMTYTKKSNPTSTEKKEEER